MVTTADVYDTHVIFTQSFPDGATHTANGDRDSVLSAFPSFKVQALDDGAIGGTKRGYLQFAGDMVGSGFHVGEWSASSAGIGGGIKGTGPLCVFTADRQIAAVLSPFSNAMAANQQFTPAEAAAGAAAGAGAATLTYGVMGNVTAIPAGYALSTIVSFSAGSVNAALTRWGDVLLAEYGKSRDAAWQKDFALQYLGYSTDNGAFYYYTTEQNKTYEQTMLDVHAYARREDIPYRYWLADSWWYFKGLRNGVKNWTAMPSVFPHGLAYVYEQTGWLVQGHNRYWSADTDYAAQNGGKWRFLVDAEGSQYALPYDQGFWDYLMRTSREWGLTTYEQDWLDDEFDNFPPLTNSATLGREWLMQMGTAAADNGLAIQYCMSHCRHMLASVEIPAVTQARASGDYQQSRSDQWSQLGTTALFAYALGVAPSKDNYWSTTTQPGNRWGDNSTEMHPRLQAAVLTLTKGPVCPSDKIGLSDRALIMRSAMDDGTLLQPGRPATQLDRMFVEAAGIGGGGGGGGGSRIRIGGGGKPEEIWFADTHVQDRRFGVLFAARLTAAHDVDAVADLGFAATDAVVAVEANTTAALSAQFDGKALTLGPNGVYDFVLFNFGVREANGWALIGEVRDKWVGVSNARVQHILSDATTLDVVVRGAPGELVTLTFAKPTGRGTVDVTCTVGQGSTARFRVPEGGCD
jgi:hypothetical protein